MDKEQNYTGVPDKLTSIEMILKKYIREQNEHNRNVNQFMLNQSLVNTTVTDGLADVKRGMYGDTKNKVLGLIDKQETMQVELNKVKKRQTNVYKIASGIVLGFNACLFFAKEFFFHK